MQKPHPYRNSNPGQGFDNNCADCGGKCRDSIHGENDDTRAAVAVPDALAPTITRTLGPGTFQRWEVRETDGTTGGRIGGLVCKLPRGVEIIGNGTLQHPLSVRLAAPLESESLALEALRRCVPWLGKMIAHGGHLESVAPNAAVGALQLAEAVLDLYGHKPAAPGTAADRITTDAARAMMALAFPGLAEAADNVPSVKAAE